MYTVLNNQRSVLPRMCRAPWERVVVALEPDGSASSGLRMLQRD